MDAGDRPFSASDIAVVDNFVPTELAGALEKLMRRPIWRYGWKSNAQRDRLAYWHAHFAGGDSKSRRDCEADLSKKARYAPVQALWRRLAEGPLRGHAPLRVYANAHTYGVEGSIHRDSSDRDNYYTTVYYAHPVWNSGWGGEIVFYNDDLSEIAASILPKPGRLVTFFGALPHCVRPPGRECTALRVSLVIKTQREPYGV
jgi:SM-20-related protein